MTEPASPDEPVPAVSPAPGTAASPPRRPGVLAALNARGFRLLYLLDGAAILAVLWLATAVQWWLRADFDPSGYLGRYVWTFPLVVAVHLAVFYFGGLYDRTPRFLARPVATRLVTSVWLAALLVGSASLLLGDFPVPRSVLVALALVGPFVLAGNRWLVARLRRRREGPARALLVGDPETVSLALDHLGQTSGEIRVVGSTETADGIAERVARDRVRLVVLLDADALEPLYHRSLDQLERAGVTTLQIVRPQDSLLGLTNVGELGGMPFVALSTHALSPSQERLKRWMDLAVLLLSAPVTVPLIALTALYVRIVAGRPVLFVQDRIGKDGRPFPMVKFRSMVVDAESGTGPVSATVDDPRIVPGMGWIRATRLDELPQLANVLVGRMTIVGPRPVRPEELAAYERRFPGYHRRHQTPPGITGLAQVYGRYHTHIAWKLGHDLHYLANWSPLLDLHIMLRTAWVVVTRRL